MTKKRSKTLKKKGNKDKTTTRRRARTQADINKRSSISIVRENRTKSSVDMPSDGAPHPTDNNGNLTHQ